MWKLILVILLIAEILIPSPVLGHASGLASIEGVIDNKTLTAKIKYPDKVFTVGVDLVTDFFKSYLKVYSDDSLCSLKVNEITPPTDTATLIYTCPAEINKLKIHSELSDNIGYTYASSFKKGNAVKNFTFDLEKRDFEASFTTQALLGNIITKVFDFVKIGMQHIYTGYDHILFLLAIIMVLSKFRRIIKAVTAFTLAHSITLILAAFGSITITSKIVEPIIALSIAYVAVENILSLTKGINVGQRRWFIAFGFGLIHGLGFAGALEEINIPKDELLLDLISFNIGIELGQLSIIAVVLPILYFLERYKWKNKLITALSLLIGTAGVFWFFERIGFLTIFENPPSQNLILIVVAFVVGFFLSTIILKPKNVWQKLRDFIKRFTLIFVIPAITLSFIPGIFDLKPQKAYAAIPSGVIVMWPSTNASIPSGWSRVTALDGRYPKMIATTGTNPGTTGGSSSHNHSFPSHTHSYNSHDHQVTSSSVGLGNSESCGSGITIALGANAGPSYEPHDHTINWASTTPSTSGGGGPGNYDNLSGEPPYYEVIFIKSDGSPTGLPNGALAYFNSTAPTGWTAHSGSNNRLMKGASTGGNGGGTGGTGNSHAHTSGNHSHTNTAHDHSYSSSSSQARPTRAHQSGGSVTFLAGTHSHPQGTVDLATAGSESTGNANPTSANGDLTPSWTKELVIENTSGSNSFPVNIIVLWDGTLASIPSGWFLTDGLSNRPNLSNDKYVMGNNASGSIGTTGGATTHTHGSGGGHSHSSGAGTHTYSGSLGAGTSVNGLSGEAACGGFGDFSGAQGDHNGSHSGNPAGHSYNANSTDPGASGSTSNDPTFTGVAYITFSNSNPNAPTIMGSSPIPGSKPNKNANTITLQGTATDPDASDTVQIDWDYSSDSGGGWTNIGTTTLGTQGTTQSLSWTVSGLTAGSGYRLRARTIDNGGATSSYTTQSSNWTLTSGCSPPVSGNLTIASSCAFPETVDGVDAGDVTINSSVTLTINAAQTVVFNALKSITVNGSTAVNSTGQIRQTNLWMIDSDADGWPSTAVQSAQDSSPGGTYRRRNLLNSDRIIDCNDAALSSTNSC